MLAYFVAVNLVTATLVPSHADTQVEDSVARFCVGTAVAWSMKDEDDMPEFAGNSPYQRGVESYWRQSFRGVSVPIPTEMDGWEFYIADSNNVKTLAGLSHEHLDISYSLFPSHVRIAMDGARKLADEFGLPGTDHDQIQLVRAAIKIEPEQVECDPGNVQATVNALYAVYLKAFVLNFHDKAYIHGDGVLGHSVEEFGERWTYLFEDESGQLYEVQIRHKNPGRYPYIGFEIDDGVLMDSMDSPPWMPLFFEAASDPTKDRLVHLRNFIIDYPLSKSTFDALDEEISQYE